MDQWIYSNRFKKPNLFVHYPAGLKIISTSITALKARPNRNAITSHTHIILDLVFWETAYFRSKMCACVAVKFGKTNTQDPAITFPGSSHK